MVHPDSGGIVRAGMTCAQRMGDKEAYAREKLFKACPAKARTVLEIEVQLRRGELSAEVRKYLEVARKRLKNKHPHDRRDDLKTGGLELWLLTEEVAALTEVLQGLKDGRSMEHLELVIDRLHLLFSEDYTADFSRRILGREPLGLKRGLPII
jgi:hypothetical protein